MGLNLKDKDRIIYIYNNYHKYSEMLKTYKASIINLMEVSAEFSRHHKSGDSDIKVQTNAVSDPTANAVCEDC